MLSLYEILKASKTGIVPDMWTALAGKNWSGAGSGAETKELTGIPPLSIRSNGTMLLDYLISGNMSRSGTPTSTTPIQPQECGERTGNLFDVTTLEIGIYLAASGNKYGNVTNGVRAGTKIKASPNTTYTISVQSSEKVSLRVLEWSNGTFAKQTPEYNASGSVSLTVTTTAETTEIAFNIEGENGQYATSIMLNLGSTAKPYEPYGYKIPISSAGQTTPVYLGEVQTVRQIYKMVLDGTEGFSQSGGGFYLVTVNPDYMRAQGSSLALCTHYATSEQTTSMSGVPDKRVSFSYGTTSQRLYLKDSDFENTTQLKTYLQQQYAAGTPVTVWYVLATPTTGIVNEPLRKIGDYADTVSMEQAGVQIPTVRGNTVIDVETTLKPSEMYIKYQG